DRAPEAPPVAARRRELAELLLALGDVAKRSEPLRLDVERAAEGDDRLGALALGPQRAALREEPLGVVGPRGRRMDRADRDRADRDVEEAATGSHSDRSPFWAWEAAGSPRSPAG